VGLHLPRKAGASRATGTRASRVALWSVLGAGALLLGGCSSDDLKRVWMPQPKDTQGEHILHLWQGAWLAAMITGVIVWGLIFYVVIAYRRRSDTDIPVQTRYNLPLEIFYTIAPVLMVIVFFAKTVSAQDAVLNNHQDTQNVIEVTGQQWEWTFNYGTDASGMVVKPNLAADENLDDQKYDYTNYSIDAGTASHTPVLVLPAGETTRFNLHSPDVIHDFGIPDFDEKMDVIPGRVNHYWVTPKVSAITAKVDPNTDGFLEPTNGTDSSSMTFRGACYELCGLHHAQMIFRVAIVSPKDYATYVKLLHDNGATDTHPYIGGQQAYTTAGLDSTDGSDQ
jgi:cytochrome c oxidase subunit II